MTCSRCQTINPEGSVTCASCGAALMQMPMGYAQPGYPPPGQPYVVMAPMMATRTSGMAIAGFVLSFLGCLSVLGLIFSLIGLSEVKNSQGTVTGGGLATAGIVISCCWGFIFLLALAS